MYYHKPKEVPWSPQALASALRDNGMFACPVGDEVHVSDAPASQSGGENDAVGDTAAEPVMKVAYDRTRTLRNVVVTFGGSRLLDTCFKETQAVLNAVGYIPADVHGCIVLARKYSTDRLTVDALAAEILECSRDRWSNIDATLIDDAVQAFAQEKEALDRLDLHVSRTLPQDQR